MVTERIGESRNLESREWKIYKAGQLIMDTLVKVVEAILCPSGKNRHGRDIFKTILAEITSTIHELIYNLGEAISNNAFLLLERSIAVKFKNDCRRREVDLNSLCLRALKNFAIWQKEGPDKKFSGMIYIYNCNI